MTRLFSALALMIVASGFADSQVLARQSARIAVDAPLEILDDVARRALASKMGPVDGGVTAAMGAAYLRDESYPDLLARSNATVRDDRGWNIGTWACLSPHGEAIERVRLFFDEVERLSFRDQSREAEFAESIVTMLEVAVQRGLCDVVLESFSRDLGYAPYAPGPVVGPVYVRAATLVSLLDHGEEQCLREALDEFAPTLIEQEVSILLKELSRKALEGDDGALLILKEYSESIRWSESHKKRLMYLGTRLDDTELIRRVLESDRRPQSEIEQARVARNQGSLLAALQSGRVGVLQALLDEGVLFADPGDERFLKPFVESAAIDGAEAFRIALDHVQSAESAYEAPVRQALLDTCLVAAIRSPDRTLWTTALQAGGRLAMTHPESDGGLGWVAEHRPDALHLALLMSRPETADDRTAMDAYIGACRAGGTSQLKTLMDLDVPLSGVTAFMALYEAASRDDPEVALWFWDQGGIFEPSDELSGVLTVAAARGQDRFLERLLRDEPRFVPVEGRQALELCFVVDPPQLRSAGVLMDAGVRLLHLRDQMEPVLDQIGDAELRQSLERAITEEPSSG